jgi:hypothetical protein
MDAVPGPAAREHPAAAKGATRYVLVCDVDVTRVVADVVCTHAALVSEPAGCERFALGASCCLPFAGNDLERDVQPVALVAGEPDGARAAASERAHGPMAAEYETPWWMGDCDRDTVRPLLPPPVELPAECPFGRSSCVNVTDRNAPDDGCDTAPVATARASQLKPARRACDGPLGRDRPRLHVNFRSHLEWRGAR